MDKFASYRKFAESLDKLLAGHRYVKFKGETWMPLYVERIAPGFEGREQIAMAHTYEQNGDLMRDPEMVFEIVVSGGVRYAIPVEFRNDSMGVLRQVFVMRGSELGFSGGTRLVYKSEERGQKSFATMWFKNLRAQGFFKRTPDEAKDG